MAGMGALHGRECKTWKLLPSQNEIIHTIIYLTLQKSNSFPSLKLQRQLHFSVFTILKGWMAIDDLQLVAQSLEFCRLM